MISRQAFEVKKKILLASLKGQNDFKLRKKTSNLFRDRVSQKSTVDVRSFTNVISIDKKKLIADVEGMITYEDLVAQTIKYGFVPAVVPELKTITIGGALTGGGVESSSFKYGYVHNTITEIEVLLSNATTVVCTPTKNKDLFYGFANSYGTLGYALRVKVKLVRIKPFVKLIHTTYTDPAEFFTAINKACIVNRVRDECQFIDATVFGKNKIILTTGTFVDSAPYASSYSFMSIYYKSLVTRTEDYVRTIDYIWRWDADWFWCAKPFLVEVPLIRFLFGIFGKLRSDTYWKIRASILKNKYLSQKLFAHKEFVVQDVEIPVEKAGDFFSFFMKEVKVLPLWICPAFSSKERFPLFETKPNQLYLNFGFWGVVPAAQEKGHCNKLIEKKVRELSGKKSLYSDSYFTEKEFWREYNKDAYDALKAKYDSELKLKNLYDKCVLKR